jgi:hypothetical protein
VSIPDRPPDRSCAGHDPVIRRNGQVVQDRPLRSVRWADIPQLSTGDRRCAGGSFPDRWPARRLLWWPDFPAVQERALFTVRHFSCLDFPRFHLLRHPGSSRAYPARPTDRPLRPGLSTHVGCIGQAPPLHVSVRGLVAEHDDHRISTAPSYRLHAVAIISEGDPVVGHRVKLDVCRRYRSRPHHRLGGVP